MQWGFEITNTRTLLAVACKRLFICQYNLRTAVCGLFYGALSIQATQTMQALLDWRSSYVLESSAYVEFAQVGIDYVYGQLYMHVQGNPGET